MLTCPTLLMPPQAEWLSMHFAFSWVSDLFTINYTTLNALDSYLVECRPSTLQSWRITVRVWQGLQGGYTNTCSQHQIIITPWACIPFVLFARFTQHLSIWWWECDSTYCVLRHLFVFSLCFPCVLHMFSIKAPCATCQPTGGFLKSQQQLGHPGKMKMADSCQPSQWLPQLREHQPPCQHYPH